MTRQRRPDPRASLRRRTALAMLAVLVAAPAANPAQEPERAREIVAEALFLAETLPGRARELSLSLVLERREPGASGDGELSAAPRLQLAAPLWARLGCTAEVGLPVDDGGIESALLSLKALLREPRPGATGLSASLDVRGSFRRQPGTEAAVAVGALRPVGPVSLRASAQAVTAVTLWAPALQLGASAGLLLGSRWRVLAEVVADLSRDANTLRAGPAAKLTLGDRLALFAGALFQVAPAVGSPAVALQLTASI